MTCFIRGDVTLNPGQIDFGTVRRSDKLPSSTLTLTYAGGRPGWEIAEMKTQSAKVKAVAEKVNRLSAGRSSGPSRRRFSRASPTDISRMKSR